MDTFRIYEYVIAQLTHTELSYQEIADGSGVSKRTLEKIARKEIFDPGVSHVEKLAAFFRAREMRSATEARAA